MSILSILNRHILSYLHNISTITLHVKLSQGSDLSVAIYKLVSVEQQARCSDNQPRYSEKPQQLGLSNPSQLVAMKTSLAAVSTLCLSQIECEKLKLNLLFTIQAFSLWREPHSLQRVLSTSRLTNPSLLVAAIITLAAASASQIAKHIFRSWHYYSLIVVTRCSEVQSRCS